MEPIAFNRAFPASTSMYTIPNGRRLVCKLGHVGPTEKGSTSSISSVKLGQVVVDTSAGYDPNKQYVIGSGQTISAVGSGSVGLTGWLEDETIVDSAPIVDIDVALPPPPPDPVDPTPPSGLNCEVWKEIYVAEPRGGFVTIEWTMSSSGELGVRYTNTTDAILTARIIVNEDDITTGTVGPGNTVSIYTKSKYSEHESGGGQYDITFVLDNGGSGTVGKSTADLKRDFGRCVAGLETPPRPPGSCDTWATVSLIPIEGQGELLIEWKMREDRKMAIKYSNLSAASPRVEFAIEGEAEREDNLGPWETIEFVTEGTYLEHEAAGGRYSFLYHVDDMGLGGGAFRPLAMMKQFFQPCISSFGADDGSVPCGVWRRLGDWTDDQIANNVSGSLVVDWTMLPDGRLQARAKNETNIDMVGKFEAAGEIMPDWPMPQGQTVLMSPNGTYQDHKAANNAYRFSFRGPGFSGGTYREGYPTLYGLFSRCIDEIEGNSSLPCDQFMHGDGGQVNEMEARVSYRMDADGRYTTEIVNRGDVDFSVEFKFVGDTSTKNQNIPKGQSFRFTSDLTYHQIMASDDARSSHLLIRIRNGLDVLSFGGHDGRGMERYFIPMFQRCIDSLAVPDEHTPEPREDCWLIKDARGSEGFLPEAKWTWTNAGGSESRMHITDKNNHTRSTTASSGSYDLDPALAPYQVRHTASPGFGSSTITVYQATITYRC